MQSRRPATRSSDQKTGEDSDASNEDAAARREHHYRGDHDRAVLRGVGTLLVGIALVGGLLFGAVVLSPYSVENFDDFEDIEIESAPSPSSDPPPAGERHPDVTDPDDPGVSSYETDVETVDSATVEDFVHAEINDRRAEHGLESLVWDGTVASVARAHTSDMASQEYFAHTNRDGEGPYDRFEDVDSYCQRYGENIALTWVDRPVEQPGDDDIVEYRTAERLATGLVDQWMNSTDHRKAILEEHGDGSWDRAGVGVYITDDGAVYAGQNFCREW